MVSLLMIVSCNRQKTKSAEARWQPSGMKVEVKSGGPVIITSSTSEFRVLPSGYVQAFLLKDNQKLTLDDPKVGAPADSDFLVQDGTEIHFTLDFDKAKVSEATGKLGRGKRVEIPAHALAPTGTDIQKTLQVELYDEFPNVLLASTEYKNAGQMDYRIDQATQQQRRLNAAMANAQVQPYDMWSFHGSSYDWGKDDVVKLGRTFSQPNLMGEEVKGGYGGGIPVVAFWTASLGEAIGHVETVPLTVSIPVKVAKDGRVEAQVSVPAKITLKPGET
ncbi:MAG TPA: hypothetical protein VH744_01840, partial [Terriglobales bacterium]